ncbi:phasin family protein [Solimonas soli]|uniref:phasin family protein n=1 Tax=Solimonas soli TaxID=413479 RepID=UPI000481C887|nr:phasin family protein [Solimonas soli]
MSVETIVNDVKSRADVVVTRGQEVLGAGVETLKAANTIVVEGVQELVQTNVAAGKELSTLVQASVSKAKTDGIKAVAANPVAYLPEGKATVVGAYTESVKIVTKTGDELAKTLKSGVETITAKIQGEAPVVAKAKKTVTKTASKAKKAAKKAAA